MVTKHHTFLKRTKSIYLRTNHLYIEGALGQKIMQQLSHTTEYDYFHHPFTLQHLAASQLQLLLFLLPERKILVEKCLFQ